MRAKIRWPLAYVQVYSRAVTASLSGAPELDCCFIGLVLLSLEFRVWCLKRLWNLCHKTPYTLFLDLPSR